MSVGPLPFIYLVVFQCMEILQFVCLPVDGHLGFFQAWIIMDKSAVDIHRSVSSYAFLFPFVKN